MQNKNNIIVGYLYRNILDLMPTTIVPNGSGQESHIQKVVDTEDDALQQQSILSECITM